MAIDKKSVRKMFPNLAKELEDGENKVRIDSVRADPEKAEQELEGVEECPQTNAEPLHAKPDLFRHYNPSIVDFIRRCDTEAQAEEIIAFMAKRREITEKDAGEIREQLKRDGLRSFGPKKESDYYCREGGVF